MRAQTVLDAVATSTLSCSGCFKCFAVKRWPLVFVLRLCVMFSCFVCLTVSFCLFCIVQFEAEIISLLPQYAEQRPTNGTGMTGIVGSSPRVGVQPLFTIFFIDDNSRRFVFRHIGWLADTATTAAAAGTGTTGNDRTSGGVRGNVTIRQDHVRAGSHSQRLPRTHRCGLHWFRQILMTSQGLNGIKTVHSRMWLQSTLQITNVIDDVLNDLQLRQLAVLRHERYQILQLRQVHLDLGVFTITVSLNSAVGNRWHRSSRSTHRCDGLHLSCSFDTNFGDFTSGYTPVSLYALETLGRSSSSENFPTLQTSL